MFRRRVLFLWFFRSHGAAGCCKASTIEGLANTGKSYTDGSGGIRMSHPDEGNYNEQETFTKCEKCSGTFWDSEFADHDCEAVQAENAARHKRLITFAMLGSML